MGESTELGMSVFSSKTMIILIGTRGCNKNGWNKAEYGSHVEEIDEKRGPFRNQHHFSTTKIFGMHST